MKHFQNLITLGLLWNVLEPILHCVPENGKPLVTTADLADVPDLDLYVKTFTYLKENDPDFWTKLIYKLPHKRKMDRQSLEPIPLQVKLVK